jgi:hypothetical protein
MFAAQGWNFRYAAGVPMPASPGSSTTGLSRLTAEPGNQIAGNSAATALAGALVRKRISLPMVMPILRAMAVSD